MSDKIRPPDLSTLRAELIADIEALSDEELLREARESGEDVDRLAEAMRSSAREALANVLRTDLAAAKDAAATRHSGQRRVRPALDDLKRIVSNALKQQPDAALAFREGRALSDNDWQTLYDDLIDLGVISPGSHAD